jgi:hypothetical protein
MGIFKTKKNKRFMVCKTPQTIELLEVGEDTKATYKTQSRCPSPIE